MTTSLFVGADISAESIDICFFNSLTQTRTLDQIGQTKNAFRKFLKALKKLAPLSDILVTMEATGTYWMEFAHLLHQNNIAVWVVNPRQITYFRKTCNLQTKTDAMDAQLIASFASQYYVPSETALWRPLPPAYHSLSTLVKRRHQLLEMITQERNRLHAWKRDPLVPPAILHDLQHHIALLKQQAKQLLQEIDTFLDSDHPWADSVHFLRSIPGIGPITIAWLLVTTHNFTLCDSPKQLVSFAGLAPHENSSGSSVRKKAFVGKRGHQALRNSLYMAAGSAKQHNPICKPFYSRLRDRGKLPKVAQCAVARKLIHIAWACVAKKRPFDMNFHKVVA